MASAAYLLILRAKSMGIFLTRIEIGGSGAGSVRGPWLGLILVAIVLPVLVLPLLLVAFFLPLSAPAEAVRLSAGGSFLPGGRICLSPRSPPLA
jgi:hypothetical protein